MAELRTVLERESVSVDLQPGSFDRLLRRRDRRVRNRRIATTVLALALAAIAIAGVVRALHGAERQLPGNRIDRGNVARLVSAWSGSVSGVPSDEAYRSFRLVSPFAPVVADREVFVGTDAGRLYAFPEKCRSRCTPDWTADLGSGVSGPPAVADGMVFAGSNDGRLFAFRVGCATGGMRCKPTWTATTGHRIHTPVVADGTVYAVSGADGVLYAFPADCAHGGAVCTPAWTRKIGVARGVPWGGEIQRPTIAGGVLYVAGDSSLADGEQPDRLFAFDASTGRPLWVGVQSGPIGGTSPFDYRPIVAEGHVFVTFGDTLHAFSVACTSGRCGPAWTFAVSGAVMGHPAVGDGVVAVKTWTSSSSTIHVLRTDCGTGGTSCAPLWSHAGQAVTPPLIANGEVYDTGVQNGSLLAFPVHCGRPCGPVWRSQPIGPANTTGFSASDGVLYLGSQNGELVALPAACRSDGGICAPRFTFEAPAGRAFPATSSLSPPVIRGRSIYVVTASGRVFAFSLPAARSHATGWSWIGPVAALALVLVVRLSLAVRERFRRVSRGT